MTMPRFRKNAGWHAAGLRRPELVWSESTFTHRRKGSDADGRAGQQHWRALDVAAMILAALQVILPYVFVLLAAVAGAYGLFMLAF
jgi:ABC-type Fe3+ transport system permease subunit